ncbi:hypothetical protein SO802_028489 [Lithocarpus litseifolius]|uniref:Uncharacterized protein n=1 Tax=Lithocarpus litseifolius TaxID=425828 RepID=A0AAW2BQF2_9ROSI
MTRIWSLPANLKIECELNVCGQPIGESGQTFIRWLGTFCLNHALCPLVPVAWTRVPKKNKLDCWIEIEAKESGQAVERATLFAKVYSTKDGTPVSTAVKEKIDKMTEILTNGCTLHGEPRDGIRWAKDDSFAQVIGAEHSGRVRGVGFGPTPSGRSGSNLPCYTSTPLSSTETAHRMTSLENSHQSMRDALTQSEQRHKEEVAEIHAKHKEQIAVALAEAKRQLDA